MSKQFRIGKFCLFTMFSRNINILCFSTIMFSGDTQFVRGNVAIIFREATHMQTIYFLPRVSQKTGAPFAKGTALNNSSKSPHVSARGCGVQKYAATNVQRSRIGADTLKWHTRLSCVSHNICQTRLSCMGIGRIVLRREAI